MPRLCLFYPNINNSISDALTHENHLVLALGRMAQEVDVVADTIVGEAVMAHSVELAWGLYVKPCSVDRGGK